MHDNSITTFVHATREKIWSAIIDPDLVEKYFFGTRLSTDWKVGSTMEFQGEWQGQPYKDLGTVMTIDPPSNLSFSYWSSLSGNADRPELRQIIRYALEEADDGVRVTVSAANYDTEERAKHSAGLWEAVLEGLKQLVETGA
jgi:uncharacterized protein YndB with AHSA1/START domain